MSLLRLGQNGYDVHMGYLLKLGRNPETRVSYGGKKTTSYINTCFSSKFKKIEKKHLGKFVREINLKDP